MLQICNIKQYGESLRNYLDSKDYARPFIVAGWHGIGKTAIATKSKRQFPELQIMDFNLTAENPAAVKTIMEEWSDASGQPRVICITTDVDLSSFRDLDFNACDIHYIELDKDLWFEWAQQKGEDGLCNINKSIVDFLKQNPEQLHGNILALSNAENVVRDGVKAILAYNGTDEEELYRLINILFEQQQRTYLRKEKVEQQWDEVLTHLTKIVPNFSPRDINRIQHLIMQVAEFNAKHYV